MLEFAAPDLAQCHAVFATGLRQLGHRIQSNGPRFFAGIYIVPLYALLQHHSPGRLGRILAANNIMNALFMVGASVLAVAYLRSVLI